MEYNPVYRARLPRTLLDSTDDELAESIISSSLDLHHERPEAFQVEAVSALVRAKKAFVHAAPGFWKNRIPEIFFSLYDDKALVLVLNRLDCLGDEQVKEKKLLNITAINLTLMTFNHETVKQIKEGCFSFVYLSPEVFLNNSLFEEMFSSSEFQNLLSLIVVEEAELMYWWSLVASKQDKLLNTFKRHEDRSRSRPFYASMSERLTEIPGVPLLLMSTTCRPAVRDSIRFNLTLRPREITMITGKLTRPEIRLLRIPMQSSLKSCDDLLRIYAPRTKVPAIKTVPTIIYSGTLDATFQVMKVVNEARSTKGHEYDPDSEFIRRFHSVTGQMDKLTNITDFAQGRVPVLSASMALGLTQNVKRVRCVIHMGRGDPSAIVQMVGNCALDGNPGLALLFMEPKRKEGKNSLDEFDPNLKQLQSDDDRMDAFAITPVCLRVALSVDSQFGYIPLSDTDPVFQAEREKEIQAELPACQCSNCAPEATQAILNLVQQMSVDNFDEILQDPLRVAKDESIVIKKRKKKPQMPVGTCSLDPDLAADLVQHLQDRFKSLYDEQYGNSASFCASQLFGKREAEAIVSHFDQIRTPVPHNLQLLERVMGGDCILDQSLLLDDSITTWMEADLYQGFLRERLARQASIRSESGPEATVEADTGPAAHKAMDREVMADAGRVQTRGLDGTMAEEETKASGLPNKQRHRNDPAPKTTSSSPVSPSKKE
ncbi:hypothetical protein PGT21_020990 [Puccinia graminis f. sp. tritici]|uniref:DNA 3'-5' helicase n=1 Tax=Puccinia graminis f. sp. tritici TaxID=56615 RepID=A0A5B0LWT0_PUCGR|nr:hypothetical protein PGTUg99_031515 [Puccinia graminis f. sp. tritici]KAA1104374.1 hypothetical protein PGT21_020990 [Puccinia graminis f. sp. tritici]